LPWRLSWIFGDSSTRSLWRTLDLQVLLETKRTKFVQEVAMDSRKERQLEIRFPLQGGAFWDRLPEEARRETKEIVCRLLQEVVEKEAGGRRQRGEREDHQPTP
jgi:hypothetical protein